MLGWLRKRAEEVAAQANVFDGGKTAATVRAQRPASSPVPTRSAPRQQAPSYGSGVGGFVNRTRDVFDANTAQDLWKRDMAAQQAWQAPMQMPKLGQSYYDEQKALDQLALQDAERRSSIEQAAYNALGGFGNRVAKTPGAIADHYADAMRNKKASNLVSDPITATTTQLAYAGDFLKGKLFGEDAPKASERAGTQVQDAAERADNTIDSTVQQSRFGQRGTDNKIVAGASRGIGDVGAQILTARATGSNVAPSALAGLQTSTAQTRAAQDAGFSYEDARSVGVTQGAVQAATEKIGLDKLKFPVGNNFLARGASRFITEGTQEGGQELLSNLITNKSYDPNKGLTEGVKEAALFGGIAGGAMGGAFDIPTLFNQNTSKPLSPNTQQKRDTLANAYTTAVDQGRPEVAQQIANQINAIDTPPTTRLVGRVQNGLSALAGDQRGSVPFELGGKQMTSALDAQAYTNFDSFYNDYKPFFADSNLDVNDARAVYEKAINEPATPTGTRGSRISSSAQTQFEQAYNVGDMETAKQFAQQIQDPTARNVALQAVGGNTTTETQVTNPTVQAMIEAAQARKQQAKPTTRLVQRVTAPFRDEAGAIGRNIRGEGGFVRGSEPDPLEALKAEARKYKSAEEFVKAQSKFTHESTTPNIDKFDINRVGSGQGDSWLGRGIYAQENGKFKIESYGKGKTDVSLSPRAKIFDVKETPNSQFRDSFVEFAVRNKLDGGLADELAANLRGSKVLNNMGELVPVNPYAQLLPRDIFKRNPGIVNELKKLGYDGLKHDGELVVYNTDALLTGKQLTDLYNQAQKPSLLKDEAGAIGRNIRDEGTQVGNITPSNQRAIDSYSTPKSVTEYKVGEKVSNATAQGGTTDGVIVKTPDFSKDLRIKGNNFVIKLNDGTTVKTDGAGFNAPVAPKTSFDTNLEQAGVKPKGFILKETKGRAGKKDTIRVKQGAKGLEATQQSEPTIEAQQYANTFGVPVEQAQQDMARMENQDPGAGTRKALDRVKNSGKDNVVDDMIDQKQYGVKDIKAEPTSTLDDFINKELGVDQLTDAEMTASNRDKGVSKLRDNIRNTNVLRKANDAAARGLEKLSRGGAIARRANRVAQYINKNAGQDPAMIEAAQKYAGENTYADASLMQIGKKAYDLLPDEASRARVHAVLDPESAGDSVKFDDLTPNEKQALSTLRDLGEAINDTSYRTGMISKKKWESNRGGRYIARLYNEVATTQDVADLLELPDKRGLHLGMYKSRVEMNDKMREQLIRDPVKLAVIRARQVRQNEALIDYMSTAESKGYVSTKPKDGFVKVTPQNRMANWSGKYVRQDVYENVEGFRAMGKGMNAVNNLLDVYDGLPPRRLRKKTLTIFNPVVRTGNVTSNYFFAYLNGVNPVTFQKNKGWAKSALKGNDPLKIAAQRSGLIGNDIISSDRNLFDARKSFMNELDASSGNKIGNKLKNMNERITQRYGEADDIAKLAAMKAHVDRGYSVKQAIDMTRRGFQDYSRVGHAYDMAAKAPVFGNAFVRFQGDLYTNIIKNAAVDHPMRLGAMVAGIALLGEGLSNLSGESDEDKKTREDRAGAPKIPFTNVSTEFQTPVGAIDVARFTPLYMRQDIDGNSFADQLSRLSPVNIPSNLSKTELIKKAASDPLIGPVISTVGDTDWRGKSVADPDGVRDGKELYPDNPLSSAERNRNRAQYGVRSYAPYPFNEIGDIAASFNQNKRNEQAKDGGKYDPRQENVDLLGRTGFNTSGSKKSLGQSIGRLGGIRAQEYNADDAAKAREDAKMFAFFDNTDKFKAGLDSKTREQFETRHKGTQTRDGIKAEFESDPWYKYKNAGELLQNPKLFEAEKKYAEMQNKYDGRPIDPLFNLPENQRNVVLAKKLKLPGSKDEGFNTLYDQDWYQNFRKKQDEFYTSKSAYAKKRGWSDYESDNPYPEAKKDVQKAIDYYFDLPAGGQRTSFRNNNPQLWAAITGQWDQQNVWTDKERAKLGLPAIPRDEKTSYSSSSGSRGSSRSRRSGRGSRGGSRSAKGKFDYKLDTFAPKGGNLSKQLAKLVENAGKKSKPKIKKTKNYA